MDSDYHLLETKELNEKENKENKNDHSSGYFRFINKFKNHLKKIENNFTGDEIIPLANHFNFINKCENELEEKRENCSNCYNALKEQISFIEKCKPDFDINIFNTFFQTFEEYYSIFIKTKEILEKFSKFNDDTQNLYYIYKRKNFCIETLKEFVDKMSEEYADKIEQYDILNQKFKELSESYDKLNKAYSECKNSNPDKYDNIENKGLIITKLNEKIQDLNIENDKINKKYNECSRELQRLNMSLKINFVLKSESEKLINEYKYKLSHFEKENIKISQQIKGLQKENEKLIEQKEYFESQINTELNNINNNNLIEEIGNEEEFEDGQDLQDLLMNCEEYESEEQAEEKKEEKTEEQKEEKIEDNKEQKKEEQKEEQKKEEQKEQKEEKKEEKKEELDKEKNNKTEKENEKVKSIIINIKDGKFGKSRSKDIDNKTKKKLLNKSKSIRFLSNNMRHSMNKPITNILKTKKSDNINNAYNIMFKGRQFQYPTRVINKDNHDYFKQFFFLLFQSMKMNSNNIGNFLGYNPEILYNECKKEHVPFHKYQKWIERKLLKKEMNENSKKIEDFSTITGVFCSSLI